MTKKIKNKKSKLSLAKKVGKRRYKINRGKISNRKSKSRKVSNRYKRKSIIQRKIKSMKGE